MFQTKHLPLVGLLIMLVIIGAVSSVHAISARQSHETAWSITQDAVIVTPTTMATSVPGPDILVNLSADKLADRNPVSTGGIPAVFHLAGMTPIYQGWNDCGPANITQALQFYGWTGTQDQAIAALKPNYDDQNVSPWELVRFVNEQTEFRALTRVGGTLPLLKQLVTAKFAVIVEIGYLVPQDGWNDHFETVLGYDDNIGTVFLGDTLLGFADDKLGQRETYDEFDETWHELNHGYTVIYPAARQAELNAILGTNADRLQNAANALAVTKIDIADVPDNGFSWFNLGSSLTILGRYSEAATAFDRSFSAVETPVPWRMLWFQFAPYEAYYNAEQYDKVLALTQSMLVTPYMEETWYWRGMVEAAKGETDAALADFNTAIQFNPRFTSAVEAKARLDSGQFLPPGQGNNFGYTASGPQP